MDRKPLASVNRDSALIRATAQKIKRRSIGLPSTAAKRPRVVPTPAATSNASLSSTSTLTRPLASSMSTGRATIAGSSLSSSANKNAPPSRLRTPLVVPTRQRAASASSNAPVDPVKEELKRKMKEMEENYTKKIEELEKNYTKKVEELEEKVDSLKDTVDDLNKDKSEAEEKVTNLKNSLRRQREEREEDRMKNQEKMEQLKKEMIEKDEQMRILHNDVVDLKGRIRVSVRVRPLLSKEEGELTDHLSYLDGTTIALEQQKGKAQSFQFNNVYGPNYSQVRIFEGTKDLILSVLHGYNVSIISYGQTGSGKTHTMRGGEGNEAGLIPRAVRFLFENRTRLEDLAWNFEFEASFLEVYNNECYDLLSTPARAKREIKQHKEKFIVDSLTTEPIVDVDRMTSLLARSDKNRSTAATKCNETSSRSHAVFALHVKGNNSTTGAKIDCVLRLVDLAGSERAKDTEATGDRFTEMTHINTALSNLQTCIRALLMKQSHVPYRNSKLTTLLQDSLGGGSKCMVILSVSPQLSIVNETKRTLEFGRNLSQTHIGAAKKRET